MILMRKNTLLFTELILEIWALSSFAFQSFKGLISIQNKTKSVRDCESQTNRAQPSQTILKNHKNGTFKLCMKFEHFLDQRPLFEVLRKSHFWTLSKMCLRLRQSAYPCG